MTGLRPIRVALVVGLLVVAAAACAGDDDSPASRANATRPPTSRTTTTTTTPTTSPSPPPPASPTTTTAPPQLQWTVSPIEGDVRARVEGSSWRPGCPVPLEDLRYVRVGHWGFDGVAHLGELIVHHDTVEDLQAVFTTLFAQRYPIRTMRLVDDFGADDDTSVAADNTSAFNCRPVTGGTRWSQHSYGRAIDVNPLENPYVSNGATSIPASVPYLDRSNVRTGMILAGDAVVDAFAARGWAWGGYWNAPVDYQHFSASGG